MITDSNDLVDEWSPRKGCDIGKQGLEKEEEENKSIAGIGRDSMCIIPGPSNGSEAGLLLFIRMLSGRRHHIQHLNFSPKGDISC